MIDNWLRKDLIDIIDRCGISEKVLSIGEQLNINILIGDRVGRLDRVSGVYFTEIPTV